MSNIPQGGRLVAERRMVSDLYVFDLETFVWEKVHIHPEDDIPQARYFHSVDVCQYLPHAISVDCSHFHP